MANGEMIELSQALAELQMSEAELQNLIARGDLRAFRSGGTVKFRKSDIEALKKERSTEPTIIIPAASVSGPAVNVDVPQDLGVDESAATVVPETTPGGAAPTVQLGGGKSGTEEIVFEDSDLRILPMEGSDASAATAEVTVTAEEPVSEAPPPPTPSKREARPSRRSSRAAEEGAPAPSRRSQAVYAREPGSPIMSALLAATCLLLVFVGSIFAVMLWKGYYNEARRAAYVPNYLQSLQQSAKDWGNPE